jgi:hypothetical protein
MNPFLNVMAFPLMPKIRLFSNLSYHCAREMFRFFGQRLPPGQVVEAACRSENGRLLAELRAKFGYLGQNGPFLREVVGNLPLSPAEMSPSSRSCAQNSVISGQTARFHEELPAFCRCLDTGLSAFGFVTELQGVISGKKLPLKT